jgi:protein deglycase
MIMCMYGFMKRVLCILENGFEEIETVAPVDLLRRAGTEVMMAGVSSMLVKGRSGISIQADALLGEMDLNGFDVLFLPGGPAVMELRNNPQVLDLIREFAGKGKIIAAICAAPLLLKDAGILEGKAFTAHFSTQTELPSTTGERVVEDGNLITSRGAGTAVEFGLALIQKLHGEAAATEVSKAIMA